MQISKYTELKIKNLLCYNFEKSQLYAKLCELNQTLHFTSSNTTDTIKFLIQENENHYILMIPKENIMKETVSDSVIALFYLDAAIKIRFEGSISEYQTFEPKVKKWLKEQSLPSPTNIYYCILQADDTFDFMIFDVYLSTDNSIL